MICLLLPSFITLQTRMSHNLPCQWVIFFYFPKSVIIFKTFDHLFQWNLIAAFWVSKFFDSSFKVIQWYLLERQIVFKFSNYSCFTWICYISDLISFHSKSSFLIFDACFFFGNLVLYFCFIHLHFHRGSKNLRHFWTSFFTFLKFFSCTCATISHISLY
mgnify:CR=1 FL=1